MKIGIHLTVGVKCALVTCCDINLLFPIYKRGIVTASFIGTFTSFHAPKSRDSFMTLPGGVTFRKAS